MSTELVINVTEQESKVALLENGQVVELYIERKRDASLVGNIYKGKIIKILPGMQSAFIDIGLDKAAFLYVADIMTDIDEYYTAFLEADSERLYLFEKASVTPQKGIPIEDLIQEGQELLVQVSKDPIGTKGARVTSYVTLPGRYIVLMPNVDHVGVSRRIENEETRQRLKGIASEIRSKGFGLIMRTASEDATYEDIKNDYEFLTMLWENIFTKKDKVSAPSLLYSDLDLVFRSIRDFMSHDIERVIIDNYDEYERVKEFSGVYFPRLHNRISFYDGREPIFDALGIELDISRALDRKVWLKSGGYIVIDQTEAMTVIDVNTGKFVGKENLENTILKTNLEAVKEIAYQIRLRNLGGIIIIDFIDMEKSENREKVFTSFMEIMKKDRAKNTIYNITELGIVQMTRKRVRESLGRILSDQCPYCEGKGFVKSPRTVAYETFDKLRKMNLQPNTIVIIKAHPKVAELLSDEERQGLENIEKKYSIRIIVNKEENLHQETCDISIL